MQLSQLSAILKHKVPEIVHTVLLPGMLCTFSETWLSLIRRVRQHKEPSDPTVPIASQSTPVDKNLTAAQSLREILVEIPSRCDRARYAGIGTSWLVTHDYASFYANLMLSLHHSGAMVVFMLVLQAAVRLLMVYIVIVCLAMIYILGLVEDLAQSLLHSGLPVSLFNGPLACILIHADHSC